MKNLIKNMILRGKFAKNHVSFPLNAVLAVDNQFEGFNKI